MHIFFHSFTFNPDMLTVVFAHPHNPRQMEMKEEEITCTAKHRYH